MESANIDTYLNGMTEQQQLEFRRWAINVALKRIDHWLKTQLASMPELPPPGLDEFVTEYNKAIEAVRRWLETPSPETQSLVAQLADSEKISQALWAVMMAIADDDIQQVPGYLTRAFGWSVKQDGDAAFAGYVMLRAMLRAAKIIVSDRTGKRNSL
jgi:hypothetical protein